LPVPLLFGLIVALAGASPVQSAAILSPRLTTALPPAVGRFAADVAWESADALLIAGERGIVRYSLRTRAVEPLVPTSPLPDGLPDPTALASDGRSVVASSSLAIGGYSLRLADHKRLSALRVHLLPLDVAVRGSRACVLGFRVADQSSDAVWCGPVEKSWTKYAPVHRIASGAEHFRQAWSFNRSSAIAMADDGSLAVITNAEPGVFRYAADGKKLETLGRTFDELVFPATGEQRRLFASDVLERYRLLLNTQPLIEDLVLTPKGPAIVVRVANKDKNRIRWELWWPRADERRVAPTPLGIERIGPLGHLQCDARGTSLACVGSHPDAKQAADFRTAEHVPYLWLFELPR